MTEEYACRLRGAVGEYAMDEADEEMHRQIHAGRERPDSCAMVHAHAEYLIERGYLVPAAVGQQRAEGDLAVARYDVEQMRAQLAQERELHQRERAALLRARRLIDVRRKTLRMEDLRQALDLGGASS